MRYLTWTVIALVAYSLVPPLSKVAAEDVPIMVVALGANVMVVVANAAVVLYFDKPDFSMLVSPNLVYIVAAGVFLTIGVLGYFYALSIGPVSVVVPLFGMFLVGSSLIGMAFLGEAVTLRKLAGLGFAGLAIYLTTT
jgi:transporter family protein